MQQHTSKTVSDNLVLTELNSLLIYSEIPDYQTMSVLIATIPVIFYCVCLKLIAWRPVNKIFNNCYSHCYVYAKPIQEECGFKVFVMPSQFKMSNLNIGH